MATNRKHYEEDEDDFDDRPRRKKRKPGGGGNALIFGLIGGGLLLVAGIAAAVVILTKDKKDSPPATETAGTDRKGSPRHPDPAASPEQNRSAAAHGVPPPQAGGGTPSPPAGFPFPKQPGFEPEPTGGAVLNEANIRKLKQNMTRAQFEAIFGKPSITNPTVQDRATYMLGEPTWTYAVNQAGSSPNYLHVMYAEGNVGMEVNFRVDAGGNHWLNGAEMVIRSAPPTRGAVHVTLFFANIDGKIDRKVLRYGPGGTLK